MNKSMIIGRVGQDPEMKFTQNGTAVCTLSVATSEKWKDKSGQQQEETEWHRVVVWNKLAEICGQYLKKGSQVYFEGKLKTRKWQDKDGNDRYTTEMVAYQMEMLGGKSESGQGGNQSQQKNNDPFPEQQSGTGGTPQTGTGTTGQDVPFAPCF